jgi:MbtH protein
MESNMPNDTDAQFVVVVNAEGQHSIVSEDWLIPLGWRSAGVTGSKSDCSKYVDQNWRDIRPKSLQDAMDRTSMD